MVDRIKSLDITPNSVVVEGAGYPALNIGAPSIGKATSVGERHFFNNNNIMRIRQNGIISYFNFAIKNLVNVNHLYIGIWRKNGSVWDRIHYEDFIGQASVSDDVKLYPSTDWDVQEGDFISLGLSITSTSGASSQLTTVSPSLSTATSFYYGDIVPTDPYDWSALAALSNCYSMKVYMKEAPQFVFIGDSLTMGATAHTSFIVNIIEESIETTMEYQFSTIAGGVTYQNMGIGLQSASNEAARFTSDVVNLHPRVAVIWPMANNSGLTKAQWLSAITDMLDACAANNIRPIIILPSPADDRSDADWHTYETDWIPDLLSTLSSSYPSVITVELLSRLGKFRSGGDAGNLWDIQTMYANGDGVHLNAAGYGEVAQAIYDAIPDASSAPIVSTDAASSIGETTATMNGTLIDDGGEDCDCSFEYGLTTGYGSETSTQSKSTGQVYSQELIGIQAGREYHYRAISTNSLGTTYGIDQIFHTGALSVKAWKSFGRSNPLSRSEI